MDQFDTIIEIPKNSKVKYEFCKESSRIRVDRILSSAYNYPYNYGYMDNTIAEDGDALDIIILNDQPIYPGTIITVKPVGVLLMRDGNSFHDLKNDPKILSYPIESVDKRYSKINDIDNVPELDKLILKDFFSNYKNNEKKVVVVDGFDNKKKAIDIINESINYNT
jgi:inorganic pyrophosphatase